LNERPLDNGGTVLEITKAGRAAIDQPKALDDLVPPPHQPQPSKPKRKDREQQPLEETLSEADPALLEKLRDWRRALAKEKKVPPYVILHNNHLADLAKRRPTTRNDLSEIKGVGPKRLELYGEALIELISTHLKSRTQPQADA
jgi:ATP-dependent DNA helicase RecQ